MSCTLTSSPAGLKRHVEQSRCHRQDLSRLLISLEIIHEAVATGSGPLQSPTLQDISSMAADWFLPAALMRDAMYCFTVLKDTLPQPWCKPQMHSGCHQLHPLCIAVEATQPVSGTRGPSMSIPLDSLCGRACSSQVLSSDVCHEGLQLGLV